MMNNAREIVARLYLGISMVLGIPSGILFVISAWDGIQLHLLTPAKQSRSARTGNLIVDGLVLGGSLVGRAFSLAGLAGDWALRSVALASFLIAAMAAALFAIGRWGARGAGLGAGFGDSSGAYPVLVFVSGSHVVSAAAADEPGGDGHGGVGVSDLDTAMTFCLSSGLAT